MRDVVEIIIKEVNKYTDNFIQYFEKYVSIKINVIFDKQRLVKEVLDKMKYIIEFVENVLIVGDDIFIFYVKGVMMKILRVFVNNGIFFYLSIFNYFIFYEYEKDFILKNINKVGILVIDNNKFFVFLG